MTSDDDKMRRLTPDTDATSDIDQASGSLGIREVFIGPEVSPRRSNTVDGLGIRAVLGRPTHPQPPSWYLGFPSRDPHLSSFLHIKAKSPPGFPVCLGFPPLPSSSEPAAKMPSHKTFRIKKKLAKKMRQNRPIPHWIRMRTDNTIRYNAKRRHWRRTKLGF
ncbi:uncharacterized protein [Elaeis guineensis]|uniref:uncharacterized protein n=1 Tax=Elaeis guineensis var. tenera TaxID=51953 RepID=UPI003C6D6839